GRTATKAASNGALAAAIRPHHHQRRPLFGRQMLVVGSHRNTLPERCCTWLLSPPWIESDAAKAQGGVIAKAKVAILGCDGTPSTAAPEALRPTSSARKTAELRKLGFKGAALFGHL